MPRNSLISRIPCRIRIMRKDRAGIPSRSRAKHPALLIALLALAGGAVGMPTQAIAGSEVGVIIPVVAPAVRSVTLTPDSTTLVHCSGGSSSSTALGFPNGTCRVEPGTITVANGEAASHIHVQTDIARPAEGAPGDPWGACSSGLPTGTPGRCSSSSGMPGINEFRLITFHSFTSNGVNAGPELSYSAQCDEAFNYPNTDDRCIAAPNQTGAPGLIFTGPSESTTMGPSANKLNVQVSWSAVP